MIRCYNGHGDRHMDKKHYDFNQGFDNQKLKGLNYRELNSLSADLREYIIKKCSINGGHLASNLGVIELTVALHHFFNLPTDKLIFDVGHQCYAHKVLSGRSLENLRKENGISGFQKKDESPYDCYEAGHSSTSISAAMGFALARDLNKEKHEVIAVIGDSSVANGLALEAINNISDFKHKVIIIINDNSRSIGAPVGLLHNVFEKLRMSKHYLFAKEKSRRFAEKHKIFKPFYKLGVKCKNILKYHLLRRNIFEAMDFYYISRVDGHDIAALEGAFKYARNATKSVVIHVTTTKGKGYKPAEEDEVGSWHGVGPFDVLTGQNLKEKDANQLSWSQVYANFLDEALAKDEKTILLTPATAVGSAIDKLIDKYPKRCFDVGIAEEHAVVLAAGIATNDYHPYISIYSTFLQRSYDELSHDVARMNLGVTLLIDRTGLVGEDGETHQGIYDVAYLMSIPNIAIAMAKDYREAQELFNFSLTYNYPLAIRYPRSLVTVNDTKDDKALSLGEWRLLKEDDGPTAVISYGPVLEHLKDLKVELINAIFQRPLNIEFLKSLLDKENIVIYDIYGTVEGFGNSVLNALNTLNYQGKVYIKCVPTTFISQGTILQQLKRYSLDPESFKKFIEDLE